MTTEEAIKILDNFSNSIKESSDLGRALEIALASMEKQIAKKAIYSEYDDNGFDEIIPYKAECPICGNEFEFGDWNEFDNHHCACGQKIDWSDIE